MADTYIGNVYRKLRFYDSFVFECTDLWGPKSEGQRNYSWVDRGVLKFEGAPEDRQVVMKAKAEVGLTGVRCDRRDSDEIELYPRNSHTVLAIRYRDWSYEIIDEDAYYDFLQDVKEQHKGKIETEASSWSDEICDYTDHSVYFTDEDGDKTLIAFKQWSKEYGHWLFHKNDDIILEESVYELEEETDLL